MDTVRILIDTDFPIMFTVHALMPILLSMVW